MAIISATAPYGAQEVLDLTVLEVYDGNERIPQPRPARADDALHVAAYFGDANGDRAYSGADVTVTQRVVVDNASGLMAYPTADPAAIADLDHTGTIAGADVTLLQRTIVGIETPAVADLPAGIVPAPPAGPASRVYIPQDLAGEQSQVVTVPVNLEVTEPAGLTLSSVDLVLEYDADRFTVGNFRAGTLLSGAGFSAPLVNTGTPGIVRLTMSAAGGTALLPQGTTGSLLLLDFTVQDTAAAGLSGINLRAEYSDGSRTTTTSVADGQLRSLALALTPAPTNAAAAAVDGLFTIRKQPVAVTQSVSTPEDTRQAITLTGTDGDGDPLTFAVLAAPTHGTLSGTAPNLTYLPDPNYNGPDSLTFQVNDGMVDSKVATVTIEVTPVNDPPTVLNPLPDQTVPEDSLWTYVVPANTFFDTDAGDALSYAATLNGGGLPSWLHFDGATRTLSGTPDDPDIGVSQISVIAKDTDGLWCREDFTVVVIEVNLAPTDLELSLSSPALYAGMPPQTGRPEPHRLRDGGRCGVTAANGHRDRRAHGAESARRDHGRAGGRARPAGVHSAGFGRRAGPDGDGAGEPGSDRGDRHHAQQRGLGGGIRRRPVHGRQLPCRNAAAGGRLQLAAGQYECAGDHSLDHVYCERYDAVATGHHRLATADGFHRPGHSHRGHGDQPPRRLRRRRANYSHESNGRAGPAIDAGAGTHKRGDGCRRRQVHDPGKTGGGLAQCGPAYGRQRGRPSYACRRTRPDQLFE
ncbi:MAG: putative Ig domain-containing protein [Planctomycetota bacterium]|nr:putative Ig domain-containing protein [Planctomycetota bacterium]